MFAQARHMLLPKDYIRYRLTGKYALDKADGSSTVLFDLKSCDWSDEVLVTHNIPRGWMPEMIDENEKKMAINFMFPAIFLAMFRTHELYSSKVGNMQCIFQRSQGESTNCEERMDFGTKYR